ncbi:hypothetical protein CO671_17050 [Rhizobium sp. M10]|nr:hypothetical protein CO671_17050 [Rhizobium sp. M10]
MPLRPLITASGPTNCFLADLRVVYGGIPPGWMPFTAAMCYALSVVRMEFEPPALQRRLDAMVQASQRAIR